MNTNWWNDARAVLAIVAVLGAFALQGIIIWDHVSTANGSTIERLREVPSIPTWTAATVSAIVGFYFGARGGGGNGNGK